MMCKAATRSVSRLPSPLSTVEVHSLRGGGASLSHVARPFTDLCSPRTAGIHFGTFVGSENESLEAVIELHEAAEEAGVATLDEPGVAEHGRIGVIDIGETVAIEVEDLMMV